MTSALGALLGPLGMLVFLLLASIFAVVLHSLWRAVNSLQVHHCTQTHRTCTAPGTLHTCTAHTLPTLAPAHTLPTLRAFSLSLCPYTISLTLPLL